MVYWWPAKYFGWIYRISDPWERILTYAAFPIVVVSVLILAHWSAVGYSCAGTVVPEVWSWELNPVFWLPFHIGGKGTLTGWYYCSGSAYPPGEHPALLSATISYWIILSFVLARIGARQARRLRPRSKSGR